MQQLSSIVPRLKIDEPLKSHTTFRIGGPARYFVDVHNRQELQGIWNLARRERVPFILLGSGSNVLASDHGFHGVVARLLGEFADYSVDDTTLIAGAGVHTALLVEKTAQQGLSGLEGLTAVPGTIGGALVGNAGTRDGSIGDVVREVEVLTESGVFATLQRGELRFEYRDSNLRKNLVLSAKMYLKKEQKNVILKKIKEIKSRRLEVQPWSLPNAGSIFKNPPGHSAGKLIEDAGLKGLRFGAAQVSEKHGNFIVNTGGAKASDVHSLIALVHNNVKDRFGISLELEIRMIGE